MIPLSTILTEGGVAISAGIIVSLFNRCILNNPRIFDCCRKPDTEDESEDESTDSRNGTASPTMGSGAVGASVDVAAFNMSL